VSGQGDDTPALAALRALGVEHEVTRTQRARSVEEAAALRGVPVAALLKTLVARRGDENYLFVLVPGDRSIDWAKLRAVLGVRRLSLPDAEDALRVTGYERGTITPFGSSTAWPVIADAAVAEQEVVSLGGGAHGTSVKLRSSVLLEVLDAELADVTKIDG
jgi:Cys-tRNA(Pro) deacylase